MTDLIVHEPHQVAVRQSNDIFSLGPKEMVTQATEMANVLKDVIKKQNLFSNIQGKEYVKAEGWNCLGTLLGILPRERSIVELPDGSYEAFVELVSVRTGQILGAGSALCSKDEKRWGGAERYARRSMAVTRATGKAYRLAFSWIVSLAGYEPTPAEEMTFVEDKDERRIKNGSSSDFRSSKGLPQSANSSQERHGKNEKATKGDIRELADSERGTIVDTGVCEKFSKDNQNHLDRLEKFLERDPSIAKEWYVEIADYLEGKETSRVKDLIQEFLLSKVPA